MKEFEVALISKALSDENRIKIIKLLTSGEKCGCDILETLSITQPTLSHHMKILTDSSLVNLSKDGKWTRYSVNCTRFKEYKEFINYIECLSKCKCGGK